MSQDPPEPSSATKHGLLSGLGNDSYTAHRLQHANPEHLYITTRRCFVGPIPEGWLKSHRSEWYKRHLHIHYSSRTATFRAGSDVGRHRRLSGLDGPSATAAYGHSFPQPDDLAEEEEDQNASDNEQEQATTEGPPAVPMPRSSDPGIGDIVKAETREEEPHDSEVPILASASTDGPSHTNRKSHSKLRGKDRESSRTSTASLSTAPEDVSRKPANRLGAVSENGSDGTETAVEDRRRASDVRGSLADGSPTNGEAAGDISSTTSLINHMKMRDDMSSAQPSEPESGGLLAQMKSKTKQKISDLVGDDEEAMTTKHQKQSPSTGLVRFNVPDDPIQTEQQVKVRLAQLGKRDTMKRLRKEKMQDGAVIKLEKMLVRVDFTKHDLPKDFDENDRQKIDSRTVEKWREYMVVCRESADEDVGFLLQTYKTRVIPAIERTHVKKKSTHEIRLDRKETRVNLFSSLDKTMVLWVPWKDGNLIYIMQPRSSANSMEWYTFLRNILGWKRSSSLQINVPDLDVSLLLDRPFEELESSRDLAQAAKGDDEAIVRTMREEQAAAGKIVQRCIDMLNKSREWGDIASIWAENEHIGLAWKRYDRLEWIHGENEKKMYGTIAMEKSHDLELRPKQHYPTTVRNRKGEALTEPAPVEGFLVRLTSQRGTTQRFGKLFYKRLYFSSHNQYLAYNRPARADPPPPPKLPMQQDKKVPTAHQIAEKIPLIYSINPYPVKDGEVAWLQSGSSGTAEQRRIRDQDAYDEDERKINLLLRCDGVVNLCNITRVRRVQRGASPADDNVDQGSDVDFDENVDDTPRDDGTTQTFDEDRTFELLLRNGLVVRLQAYDKTTKIEWMKRLNDLIRYWKLRTATDTSLYKSVRKQNLEFFTIDEETEAFMGQFARKWEVTKSFASPELYNMCGISSCRNIHMAGILYRKPRIHASFSRSLVILSHGHLLVFQDSLRSRSGKLLPYTHHEKTNVLDLRDCYIYSGLITESDLPYADKSFDSRHPGRHALPRMYLEDGWTSTDEDTMTCFVVWHGKRRSWFRSDTADDDAGSKRQRLKHLSKLGVTGRSVVFKTRSRAERDHWVLSIAMEIERSARSEDVRLVGEGGQSG